MSEYPLNIHNNIIIPSGRQRKKKTRRKKKTILHCSWHQVCYMVWYVISTARSSSSRCTYRLLVDYLRINNEKLCDMCSIMAVLVLLCTLYFYSRCLMTLLLVVSAIIRRRFFVRFVVITVKLQSSPGRPNNSQYQVFARRGGEI